MTAKKISIGVSIAILATAGGLFFFLDKAINENNITEQKTDTQKTTVQPKVEKKHDLYFIGFKFIHAVFIFCKCAGKDADRRIHYDRGNEPC